ncbi:uncharacterized protein LOC129765685 [Toxorhynchites rutilus septentrionalis]|uniref:uncharacterized protein LOC129765685 n=1 Tax=Toxorhynchites rutilus septentrionalis TaxID=329112 RepID=UPI00247A304F|nr:uncharacterized protein LOC129765685 [Toxorhynchites rutilus septentrionalis]
MKEEILKRLDREENEFNVNLAYGMKLWRSNSFYYMSKYEVVFDYFLDGVCKFQQQKISSLSEEEFCGKWRIVNEFLALPCPSNALPAGVISKLIQMLSKLDNEKNPFHSRTLLETFFIVSFDNKYKNFYKFDYLRYGEALKCALGYYKKYLEVHFDKTQDEETIKRILADINIYIKIAGEEKKWQTAFTSALPCICDVILQLKSNGLDYQEDLLELLKQVYFQDGKESLYNKVADLSKKHLLMNHFDATKLPLHAIALLVEGYLRAYREIKLDILLFLKYILLRVFVDHEKSLLSDVHQIFQLTNYVFYLLRKYFIKVDQKLVQDFDFTGMFTIKLKEFLEKYGTSEPHLRDIFSLVCTINDYNPLILEKSIFDITLKTMFVAKGPESSKQFQAMIVSMIGMYMKLNRSENLREEFFQKLDDYLGENDLNGAIKALRKGSKKRKSMIASETSQKRRKTDDGEQEVEVQSVDSGFYFKVLYSSGDEATGSRVFRLHLQDQFKSISFAWPDANGALSQAMMDYIKGLLTKRSFIFWRKMQDYLSDVLEALEEDQSEAELFKLELATCWMCYFFAGNTLIEQTNLFWEKLNKYFAGFDEILSNFGSLILNGTLRDSRVFSSYLNLVYFYGNYRLLVHYYHPDSIEDSQNHLIHQFLEADEWKQLKEVVPSCERSRLDRIMLQKVRAAQLTNEPFDSAQQTQLVDKILEHTEFDQIRWLLLDRSTNCWFLKLINVQQKASLVNQLLRNGCFEEIKCIVSQLEDDYTLLQVIIVSIYQQIVETLAENKASVAKKFSFEDIFEIDADKIMGRVRKLLEKKAEKRDESVSVKIPDDLNNLLEVLSHIKIDETPDDIKTIIVGINILIFADLFGCGEDAIVSCHKNILCKQLTFGMVPNLFKFLDVETLLTVFGHSSAFTVTVFRQTAIFLTDESFETFRLILERFLQQGEERFGLVLLIFNCLQKNNANKRKLVETEKLSELLSSYVSAIEAFIAGKTAKKLRKSEPDTFNNALKACSLIIRYKADKKQELSDDLREIVLQYLDQALRVSGNSASELLTKALQHKDYLKLTPERIEAIVENRWSGFLVRLREEVCGSSTEDNETDIDGNLQIQNVKIFVNFLTHHQPTAKFAKRMVQLESDVTTDKSYVAKQIKLRVYSTFARNAFASGVSQEIEKSFVRSFGNMVANEILPLCVLKVFFEDNGCLQEILKCFSAFVSNPKLTLVPSVMDNMLEFLSSINIRKYTIVDGDETTFYHLHRSISDVLYLLIITRPNYVLNRLPHYFYVYNGLVASVICYKEERPIEKPLNSFEILTLSDLLLPLEKIMSLAEKKVETNLRILAPYILVQIISYIIASKRSTTLHERISRSVFNICYGLIGMYDKHSSGYILRTCDEASKNVYAEMVKGFHKYRSFRGKV